MARPRALGLVLAPSDSASREVLLAAATVAGHGAPRDGPVGEPGLAGSLSDPLPVR